VRGVRREASVTCEVRDAEQIEIQLMKKVYVLLLALPGVGCTYFSTQEKKGFDYCYTGGHGLYVANYGNGDPQHVYINGTDPVLSPDGTCIAYTDNGAPDHERRIAVLDLEAGKVAVLDTACHNCYGPVWSPDGEYLAYNAFQGSNWGIKYVDKGNLHPAVLAAPTDSLPGYFGPTWSADSRKIVVQNMSAVYIYDLDGKVLRSVPFSQMDTSVSFSSSSTFLLTDKEDKLVCWGEVDEQSDAEEGPPGAVFVYDLGTGKTSRISPKGYDCWGPVVKGDTVFCNGHSRGKGKDNVYRVDLDGGHFKLAYKNRSAMSFAAR